MLVRRRSTVIAASLLALLLAGPLAAQAPTRKLQLSFDQQGNVTLIAEGVTVNEVLREWTRVGGSHFPGAEKLVNTPLPPLQFEGRPEVEVLRSLLRPAAGYLIAARTTGLAGPSRVNATIVATSTATASSSAYSTATSPAVPVFTPATADDGSQAAMGVQQGKVDPPADRPAQNTAPGPAQVTVPTIQPFGTPAAQPGKADPPKPGGRGGGSPR